jgi:O-antigen ligase
MILAAGLVALIGLAYAHRSRNRWRLILTAALGTLLGIAILETGSRGGLAAALGGVLVFALAADSLRARLRNATIGALAISLLILGTLHVPMMRNRLEDSVRTGNLAGRELLYPALWTMFLEKPVLGWGPVTNTYEVALRIGERERPSRAAHNIGLELLTATGLIGAVPFFLGAWLCARSAWRARREAHGVLPFALLCSVLISNMSGDWIASKLIWVVLAYALASSRWAAATLQPRLVVAPAPSRVSYSRRIDAGAAALAAVPATRRGDF